VGGGRAVIAIILCWTVRALTRNTERGDVKQNFIIESSFLRGWIPF